ncbi:MAG: DUF5680 domain-containing protein [Candidatus Nomurabacteria bacterium]|jgi:hypothetical protein|nr:DUF5680 domain-containing protein [Candidatus Nomurabacteria bacterium]
MNNQLKKFLIEAKKQTYANQNVEKVASLRPFSEDYHYEAEIDGVKMVYHDTYFGGEKFIGEEVVYAGEGRPVWGMNYYGVALDENLTEEAMDKALRPALMKAGEDTAILPLRGPREFVNGDYRYTFSVEGDLDYFTGVEEISKGGEIVYRLYCHGGVIK